MPLIPILLHVPSWRLGTIVTIELVDAEKQELLKTNQKNIPMHSGTAGMKADPICLQIGNTSANVSSERW